MQESLINISGREVLSVKVDVDCHIRFLSSLKGMAKAFRIECQVKSNEESITLRKAITQADQGSKMNVISKLLKEQLRIQKRQLSNIEFHDLIMRIVDFRDTSLKYWIEFSITVFGIFRIIRCFVSLGIFILGSSRFEHYNLLLSLSWLFSVNVIIHVWESKIIIENLSQEKSETEIVDLEMTFCTKHTLIMYLMKALIKKYRQSQIEDVESNDSEFEFEDKLFEDNLSDIDEMIFRKNFWLVLSMTLNCLNQIKKKSLDSRYCFRIASLNFYIFCLCIRLRF